ncbi:MAG: molecular chaperone TorD family protein [Gammaproteobacteria bacterium]
MTAVRNIAVSANERSTWYRFFSESFRYPSNAQADEVAIETDRPTGADFLASFDPAVSSQACSLYESDYTSIDRSAVFEELVRFYSYFGLVRDTDAEPPDHLSVELEFMHFLTYLEHTSQERGEALEGIRRAQHDFLSRHLLTILKGLKKKRTTNHVFYDRLLQDLRQFVDDELSIETA